jgi:hypothetical protein
VLVAHPVILADQQDRKLRASLGKELTRPYLGKNTDTKRLGVWLKW